MITGGGPVGSAITGLEGPTRPARPEADGISGVAMRAEAGPSARAGRFEVRRAMKLDKRKGAGRSLVIALVAIVAPAAHRDSLAPASAGRVGNPRLLLRGVLEVSRPKGRGACPCASDSGVKLYL